MKLSELYGKRIENKSGKAGGCVLGAVCGADNKAALICCDGEEKEFYVGVDSVICAGESVIYSDTGERIKKAAPLRLGAACYTENGKYLGRAADFECRGNSLKSAVIGKKKYAAERLVFGDVIIVRGRAGKPVAPDCERAAKDLFIEAVCSR